MNTINEIADAVHANAVAHGFHDAQKTDDDFINYQLNNAHGELCELHDAWRAGKLHHPCDKAEKMMELGLSPLSCLEEEEADTIIRCLDRCRRLGVDIAMAIKIKHAYNISRPFMHGKKS